MYHNPVRLIKVLSKSRLHATIACAGLALIALQCSCNNNSKAPQADTTNNLFKLLPAEQTHIDFENTLTEGLNTNILMYEYFYNGGGVATGDLNGDGLPDVYFTGNMTDNKLYLNQGHLQFKDITAEAGVSGRPGPWKTGVTMADVNGDSKLDLYICYSGKMRPQLRVNQLLINQGNNANGIPVFTDMTAQYGLDFPSYSTQAYFFDHDRDGDLDLLLVNHNPKRISIMDETFVKDVSSRTDAEAGLRLLKNDNNHFTDITASAGIVNNALSYGLAAGIADINNDGWPDIYVSNDYSIPDRLYISNKKGGYTDELQKRLGHTSFFSMGNDITDVNNDGRPDIYTLDMLPEDNKRQKLLFGIDNYEAFDLNLRVGFYYQYMRNMLHINNGNNTFSEIGQLAGVSNTDWSWAPLFADYDNDGWKDLFVTNGYTRDYTNMDFLKYMGDNLKDPRIMREDLLNIVKQMPSSEVKSYLFKNSGNGAFNNVSEQWGITLPANSNGAAYADLDNDGDLDLVVNNINRPAFIYENQADKKNSNHHLSINLKGAGLNTMGIGARVTIYHQGKQQSLEQMPTRGYQSTVSPVLHFGLGNHRQIDSLRITWLRGASQLLTNLSADKPLTLQEAEAQPATVVTPPVMPLFEPVAAAISPGETETSVNDFKRQPLLPNAISFTGACLAKADVNGDGLEDVYVGGHDAQPGMLYLQQTGGKFMPKNSNAFVADAKSTDAAAAFFDANHDGKTDLYVCSGGYGDYQADDPALQDRLYLNDGRGNFTKAIGALPKMTVSKSCVAVADINSDGYPDLFVGGRVIPGQYPETPESYLLINDGKGRFSNHTTAYNNALKNIGMVTDARFADMNADKKPDLVITGEWMPVMIFENNNGKFINATAKYFPKQYYGWWNSLHIDDVNNDGHPDIFAGNFGLNTQCKASDAEPAELLYKDFDDNGSVDPILCFYIQHVSYPFVTRDELLDQMSIMRTRFPDYKSYADASLDKIFTPDELQGAKKLKATHLATTLFISNNTGKLHPAALPPQAQYAPVHAIHAFDYNHDGKTDVLLCGNNNNARIRFGKYDANYGILLKGDGNGGFTYINQQLSGLSLRGDVRRVLQLNKLLLFSMDNGRLKTYKQR